MSSKNKVLIVGGPTASGKSGLAIEIAKKCNGVVINADSMQIYDGLHMLTAQPSLEEQKIVPHYLYGALEPEDLCSAAKWCKMARTAILDAQEQEKLSILTGGTGFYLKAMTEGLSPIPAVPKDILQATINLCEEQGREEFAEQLEQLDPKIAKRIDMQNPQRMIRAWSVLQATGKSLADWQDEPREPMFDNVDFVEVAVIPTRETLYERCNMRLEWMVDNGVLAEVESFMDEIISGKIDGNVQLTGALGFAELANYIAGDCSKESAILNAQQSTRRYAKRQSTWFNNQMSGNHVVTSITDNAIEEISRIIESH